MTPMMYCAVTRVAHNGYLIFDINVYTHWLVMTTDKGRLLAVKRSACDSDAYALWLVLVVHCIVRE